MIAINLIQDLIDIVKDDLDHNVRIMIDRYGVAVYLDDDPEDECDEKYMIPIRYDIYLDCAGIPYSEFMRCMHEPNEDIAIEYDEIILIHKIMEYLENNKVEIDKMCSNLSVRCKSNNSKVTS
ncbi:hypothetical protein [Faecalicatena contorta]|uniref:hypothetical protein n=2 Tax=Faecalicatena contorta TaxID=39482 RepID=UPI0019603DDA|nr:hypothetical protein [Faecalicatena contorta]